MPLLTRQDPLVELFKFYGLVGVAITKTEKILGEILKDLFYLIFCVTFVHLSLSDSSFSLYLFLSSHLLFSALLCL